MAMLFATVAAMLLASVSGGIEVLPGRFLDAAEDRVGPAADRVAEWLDNQVRTLRGGIGALAHEFGDTAGPGRTPLRHRGPIVRLPRMKHRSGSATWQTIAAAADPFQDGAHEGAREYRGGVSRLRSAGDHRRGNAGNPARSTALD